MSYRVETASSARAVCRSKECKDEGISIPKGDLRMGTWVPFKEGGSWHWRHWGCVTGKQILNMRTYLEDPRNLGNYRWDALDGYEGEEKHSLENHPKLQEKVRRVITQGFIDPEDFNGDAEMNVLGATGIRTPASKKTMREDKKVHDQDIGALQERATVLNAEIATLREAEASTAQKEAELKEVVAELTKAGSVNTTPKKRVIDEDAPEETPKKKRKTKAKKEDDDVLEDVKQSKKPRAKKAVKKEESEEDKEVIPAKKYRSKAVKKEDSEEAEALPAKKARGKKAVKKENADVDTIKDEPDFDSAADLPAPKKRATRGKKVKEEAVEEKYGLSDVKLSDFTPKVLVKRVRLEKVVKEEALAENGDDEATEAPDVKKVLVKKRRGKKAVKEEATSDDIDEAVKPKAKKGRGKKATKGFASEDETSDIEPKVARSKVSKRLAAIKPLPAGSSSDNEAAEEFAVTFLTEPDLEAPTDEEEAEPQKKTLKGKVAAPAKPLARRTSGRGKLET